MQGEERPDEAEQRAVTARLAAEPAPVMPDDVATRLADVLRREAEARAGSATGADEVPRLDARRGARRRSVLPLLAAAAVTVGVVAVGGTVLVQQQGGGDDAAGGAGSAESAPGGDLAQDEGGPSTMRRTEPEPPAAAPEPVAVDDLADVPLDALPPVLPTAASSLTCEDAALAAGDATRQVLLRGAPVWLVVTSDGPRTLTALSCVDVPDGDAPVSVGSAVLP